jgi:septal ring factor EnvC (AmiA/AmiB activator)
MVKEIGSLNLQIKNEMAELTKRKKSVVALKNEKTTLVNNISRKRKQRKILLKEVKAQKDAEYRAIENLITDQNRISNIIEVLLTNRSALDKKAAKEFTKLRGKLIWPVQGKIIRKFGKIKDKKYNTVISNPGIDIKAMANAPVYASSTGMVAYVSWLRGYGSFIILDHGGGYYTLYAHLDDILVETNQFVAAGEKLATISETGTFSGPMLHFELRSGKEQLDPLPWLR